MFRMRCLGTALLCALASGAAAQEVVSPGSGVVLRALDKLNGTVADVELANGQSRALGRIEITVNECRYPEGNPAGDAFAYLEVREVGVSEPVFQGWMIASAPALNPMDHPRYDVWVLRCQTS
ncbi:DUF2155 domain-containing protein [Thalassococcus sp. BH17M4-6]|uniref:DUF2155 domain-containing protein n=1 Tax=Thalassococcus sp. BH17M4-6 TaxID=3413148 RepID=UPI003BDD5F93